jgi:hypothetical protein
MPMYEHRQASPWMIAPLTAFAVLVVVFALLGRTPYSSALLLLAVTAVAGSLIVLSTRVDSNAVSWSFTFGIPSGTIPLADIAEAQITKTNFFEGFGVHWTFTHGWLWNVWGFSAVMIRKRDGGIVTLGTDDAQGLYEAIARAREGRS